MPKRFFDLLLVVPLEEELLEVQQVFPQREDLSSETAYRYDAVIGDCELTMLVVQQEEIRMAMFRRSSSAMAHC
jgi:hypothetical protein